MNNMTNKQLGAAVARRYEAAIIWARGTRGAMVRVAEELSRLAGRPVTRQQVEQWMDNDNNNRVEPRLTTGLHLLQAAEVARRKMES